MTMGSLLAILIRQLEAGGAERAADDHARYDERGAGGARDVTQAIGTEKSARL